MKLKKILSPTRFYKSLLYSLNGLKYLIKNEVNFNIHILAAILVIIAGIYFKLQTWEWCVITIAIGSVMTAEGLNTSIEILTDLVTKEHHPLAEKTKDTAAGAVLITTIMAIILGIIIFLPKLL